MSKGEVDEAGPAPQEEKAARGWLRHPALVAGVGPLVTVIASALVTIMLGQSGQLPESLNPAPPTMTVTATSTASVTTTALGPTITETVGPSGGPSSSGPPPSGPPAAGQTANINDIEAGGSFFQQEVAEVNGVTYADSATTSAGRCYGKKAQRYQLSRHYNRFVATIGISDPSAPDLKVQFRIYLDNKEVQAPITLGKGTSRKVDLQLNKALEMRLEVIPVAGNSNCDQVSRAVWGEPVVYLIPA
ncbi:NPCBM/NEW2 domain-containing protein [Streptomyces sp. SID13031]|uniref:NPCBM/NEW2 domain-containing protein n=1 Tax=Streptomyces sp. SID13031 TaxID=2706046 RepID=UPI0013C5B1A3|nr:NPCBM/NEW2 domain-containing protein [Streptomyces sp. SID13031]NEA37194.1 hypothetical protein [Streptomyces sp. SID13031]